MMEEEKINFQNFLLKYQKNNGDKLLPNTIDRYTYYLKSYDLSNLDGQELVDKMQDVINHRPAQVLFATFRMYLQFRGYDKHHELYKKLIPPRKRANSQSSYRFFQSKTLSKTEVDKLIDESDSFGKMLFLLMFDTGMRRSEILSVRHKDINILRKPKNEIYAKISILGKGEKNRSVYLRKQSVEAIKKLYPYKIPEKKLIEFYGDDGKLLKCQDSALYYYVKKEIKRILGRNLSPHSLRHALGKHLADVGSDVLSISKYLGHSDVKITQIYTRGNIHQGQQAFKNINKDLE